MDHDPTTPPAALPFEQLEQISTIEIDRYCAGCGYNLRQQAVRREPGTALLMCRCPECGDFQPANAMTTASKSWFGQLVVLLWVGWFMVWLGLLTASVASTTGLALTTGQTRQDWVEVQQQNPNHGHMSYYSNHRIQLRPMRKEDKWILALTAIGALLIGAVMTGLCTIFMPHWPRWGYTLLAVGWPAIVVLIVHGLALPDYYNWQTVSPAFMAWHSGCAMFIEANALLGGILAIWLGRPTTRLIVRVIIPPKRRGPFAYLWLVDAKTPPKTVS